MQLVLSLEGMKAHEGEGKVNKASLLFAVALAGTLAASAQASWQIRPSLELQQAVRRTRIIMFKPGVSREMMERSIQEAGGEPVRYIELINAMTAEFPHGVSMPLINSLHIKEIVEDGFAYLVVAQEEPVKQPEQSIPWGISKVRAAPYWNVSAKPVVVCVIDSGIQTNHPDLAGVTVGGENLLDSAKSIEDEIDHGTHVSGIIAAQNNDIGVVGVHPQAKIFAAKVFGNQGSTSWSTVVAAIDSCVRNQTQVINMSLGGPSGNKAVEEAVKKAYQAGLVIVAAAGNSGGKVSYPAAYDEVIAVAASDEEDKRAYFSSKGKEVDYIAPGVRVHSTITGSTYASFSGTSMASPHVAGAVALALAIQPDLEAAQVRDVLDTCVQDINLPAEEQGKGLLDLGADTCALKKAIPFSAMAGLGALKKASFQPIKAVVDLRRDLSLFFGN